MKRILPFVAIIITFLFLTACASVQTQTKQYKGSDNLLLKRDVAAVIKNVELNKAKTYKEKDRVLEYLDLGMLYHYQGDYAKSNEQLELAEQSMEDLYTKSVSKAALSMLLNDNALDYFGEDYEDIYTNVFKALNYLHQDKFDEAFVEIRRVNLKLGMLEDKYQKMAAGFNSSKDKKTDMKAGTNKFTNSAVGRYLSMLMYAKEGMADDAKLDYEQLQAAYTMQPDIYNFSAPKVYDPLRQLADPSLHVVSLIGRSPYKRYYELNISTSKDNIHVVAVDKHIEDVDIFWPGVNQNLYFKFTMPYIVNYDTEVERVNVVIDGTSYPLGKIEDIGNVAVQTFKVKEPIIFMKSLTRTVIKGLLAEAAKVKMKEQNPGLAGGLMSLATDVAVYASEQADTRISRFFPNDLLVGDIPLSVGQHSVAIEYYHKNGNLLYRDDKGMVDVTKDGFNFVESWQIQ
jgi:hypothetical protein